MRTGTPRSRHARDDPGAQRARRRRDRDQHLVGLDVLEHARQVRPSCRARATPRSIRAPLLARVVVDEADGPVAEVRVAQDLAQQQAAAVAGADDQHRARVAARAEAAQRALVEQVDEEARSRR